MSSGKNILIAFISCLLIISIVISVTLITTNSLLQPEIYAEVIDETNVSDFIDLENSTSKIPGGEFIEIPEESAEVIAEDLITNFLSYLRGDSEELNLTLQVNNASLREFFLEAVERFPVCFSGENPYKGNGEPVCRPENQSSSEFLDEVLEENNITIKEETSIDLTKVYGLENSEELREVRKYTKNYSLIVYAFLLLNLILAGLIFFIQREDFKKGAMTLGINLTLSGIIVIVLASVLSSLSGNANINSELARKFVASMTNYLISRYNLYGWVTLGIGAITTGSSFLIKKKNTSLSK